ncbi:N-acetylglucosamine kinase [Streptacidiphilus fuscans]|uniref:ATPase n=1 Tax=Streptacidiphilus fuscans TaxID=2789292 RepID=A0A931AY19_9ACTN|nr:BadF/BadG/BcrA/BcrD ATPase family protein [Streptacidiphilus fuscans]MBF9066954.1 ATPase [Streptacidiphilus fuscans]
MAAVLAVDLGKTGCRAGLWLDPAGLCEGPGSTDGADAPLATRQLPGAPGLAAPDGAAQAEALVRSVSAELLAETGIDQLDALCIGAAGAIAAPDAARALAETLLDAIPTDQVAVTSDAVTAHAGALGTATGVVLAAGTGAVALGVGEAGAFSVVDGWGPWLGDEGSGAWIGLAGLRAALRARDGRGEPTTLSHEATELFGDLGRLPGVLEQGGNPARSAASFAPAVARSAAAGDPVAVAILRDAAAALATTVATAARLTAPSGGSGARADEEPVTVTVAVTGGLVHLGAPLLDPLHAALARHRPRLRLQEALGDPLHGARLLARQADGPHEPLVTRLHRRAPSAASTGGGTGHS